MLSTWELFSGLNKQVADDSRARLGRRTSSEVSSHGDTDAIPLTAFDTRAATENFVDTPLETEALVQICRSVHSADLELWPEVAKKSPLRVLIALRNGASLASGMYEDGPDSLSLLVAVDDPDFLDGLVLQPEFATASAIIVVAGSLAGAIEVDGEHGYRLLLDRAGAAGQTAWLSSIVEGLDGCVFAGLLPAALNKLLGFDGFYRTQLLAFAVGVAADDPGASS